MATRTTLKVTAVTSMSALALAALTTTAQADGPNFYGTFDVGIESFSGPSGDANRAGGIFPGLGTSRDFSGNESTMDAADQDASMINGFKTNVGVQGGEDLGAGLSANYQLELGIEILDGGNPGTELRLGWAGLAGDWGEVRVGTQWTALFDYVAWNTNRNDIHTGSAYFNAVSVLGTGGFDAGTFGSLNDGFRQDSAVTYMYGSPYDYSNPFTAQVQLGIGEGDQNESAVSSVQVAGQYAFDERFIVNALYAQDIVDDAGAAVLGSDEPWLAAVGGRLVADEALEFGLNYIYSDDDNGNDLSTYIFGVFFDPVGTGFSTDWSFATSDGDFREMDYNVTGTVRYSFTDRTNVRLEGERVEYDDDNVASETVGLVGLQHSF